jgi:L-aspartate oxidase
MDELITTDFLVIGSGVAGLSFALKACKHGSVTIITKKSDTESNTNYAQGGIASVWSKDDSPDLHIKDTLKAGAGLCHQDAVELVIREGPARIEELMRWGVEFSRNRKGDLSLGREGGHSRDRIVHAGDLTGAEIEKALVTRAEENGGIWILENHVAIDLITVPKVRERKIPPTGTRCWGAYVLDVENRKVITVLAKVVLLCTGGAGRVYLHTTNPDIATGDGIAMAYRAGAKIANLEFMQFHPTTLYPPREQSFLITEAVRGFGGILRTQDGVAFMGEYSPLKDLAPRDVVARAIDRELKRRGEEFVLLDITHKGSDEVKQRFPHIHQTLMEAGIDMTRELIPVVPAAHYMCGGVVTDTSGRTSIQGLYAAGEVAMTGVHGANRLASNSLLEAVVFAHRAVEIASTELKEISDRFPSVPRWSDEGTMNHEEWVLISHDKREIQQLMWDYVGIVRSNLRLLRAQRRIDLIAEEINSFYWKTPVSEGIVELRNIALVAQLIIFCALTRRESRGLHYNTDYPDRDDHAWKKDTVI